MQAFRDTSGREWQISITTHAAKRVRDLVGFDMLDESDEQRFPRLFTDVILLVDVLYAVCKPKADELKMTDEQFGEALVGDVIADARAALVGSIADFSPAPKRAIHLKTIAKMAEAEAVAMELASDRADEINVRAMLLAQVGKLSTASPDTSALTPAP